MMLDNSPDMVIFMKFPDVHSTGITDLDLQALVDGEFDMETHDRLMETVKKHPQLLLRVEALYTQKLMLKDWWRSFPQS